MGTAADTTTVPAASPGEYFTLLKPRVMSLVVFTGAVGVWLAPGSLHPVLAVSAILSIALAAGAAGCINMWYERDIDALMQRTRHRPIPAGRISAQSALEFGVVLSVTSIVMMGIATNWFAAALLTVTIAFYVFIYTIWLKRRTHWNIVIGGAAGAFPPLIGWAAVTGDVALLPIVLFALIFMWTPPHFWSLALYRSDDYQRAGIPMLPVTSGSTATIRQILAYAVLLVPLSVTPWFIGATGFLYAVGAAILSVVFVGGAVRLLVSRNDSSARWLFRYSIIYLTGLFALLIVDRLLSGF